MNPLLRSSLALLVAALALCLAACAQGDDDDDDDDVADDDDAADDDDDDDDGVAPTISGLTLYPEEVDRGDALNFYVHFVDPDGDLVGGTIYAKLDDADQEPVQILHELRVEGDLVSHVLVPDDTAAGAHTIEVQISDAAGRRSNALTAEFQVSEPNHAPTLSDLRFDPNPVCNLSGSQATMLVDFADPDGNLGGGMLLIVVDGQSWNPFIIDPGLEDLEGTLEVTITLTEDAPDPSSSEFSVQVADSLGAASNTLVGELIISSAACD